METIRYTLNNLDLVVDALDSARVDRMPAMTQDPIPVTLQPLGERYQLGMPVLTSDFAPLVQRFFRPARTPVVPDVSQQILEPIERVQPFVHGQDFTEANALVALEIPPVLEEQIPAPLERLPAIAISLAELFVANLVDDPTERPDHMEQIEHDIGLRTPMPNGFDIRIPHVDGNSLDPLANEPRHLLEECIERSNAVASAHPDHAARVVVEDDGHVVVLPFFQGDFVDSQPSKTGVTGFAELGFEDSLVDGFDGFDIEIEVIRHGGHAEPLLTQLGGIGGQSMGDALMVIEEFEVFDANAATRIAPDFAILDLEPHRAVSEVEIADEPPGMRVDGPSRSLADVASWPIPLIGFDADQSGSGFVVDVLSYHLDSTPREIFGYTKAGHRRSPFVAKQFVANTCLTTGDPVSIYFQGLMSPTKLDESQNEELRIGGEDGEDGIADGR